MNGSRNYLKDLLVNIDENSYYGETNDFTGETNNALTPMQIYLTMFNKFTLPKNHWVVLKISIVIRQ